MKTLWNFAGFVLARSSKVSRVDPWLVFAFCSLASATAFAYFWARRRGSQGPLPHATAPGLPSVDALASMAGDLAAVRAEWAAWRKQVEAYLDSFDDLAELVERRRKRASAAESRMKRERGEEEAAEPADPLAARRELRSRARAMGIEV